MDFFTRLTFALHGDTFKAATISFDIKVFARLNSPHSLQVRPLEKKGDHLEKQGVFSDLLSSSYIAVDTLAIHAVTRHMTSIGWFDNACHRNPSLLRTGIDFSLVKKVTSPLL